MSITKVNIIGFGNTGQTLYRALKHQLESIHVFSRTPKGDLPDNSINNILDLPDDVDLNILCISDDYIAEVSGQLNREIPLVHTSGSVPLHVLNAIKHCGVLYPLQTLSKNRNIDLHQVPFLIEANTPDFEQDLTLFCQQYISKNTHLVSSDQRMHLHLAAVMTNNFTTYLFGQASEILEKEGLPLDLLNPLIKETTTKFLELGYPDSQTGPARRNDMKTIEKHLKSLDDSEMKQVYQLISELIRKRFNP